MTSAHAIPRLRGKPLLGHMFEFRSARMELLNRAARAHPDIARVRLGVFETLFVSSPELVHEMLVDKPEAFRKSLAVTVFAKPLLGDGLLRLEQAAHKKRRRMVAPAFMPRRIASYAAEMVARAGAASERIAQAGEVDMADETMRVALSIVAKTLFGAELERDAHEVGAALTRTMDCIMAALTSAIPMPPQVPTPTNLRGRRAVERLDKIVYRMIAERRAQPSATQSDLLALLLETRDETDHSALSDREVRDEAMTLFLAGHETVANTLAWSLYLLAAHPEVHARLETEVDAVFAQGGLDANSLARLRFTSQVIHEAMRLYPPAYMFGRIARHDLTLGDYAIERGTVLLVNVFGMHRRPDLFPEPERFDPDRFAPERAPELPRHAFIPFGAGPRICIGNHFALMEAALTLATFVHRLRFELVDPARVPEFEPLITLRPRGGIRMRVGPRVAEATRLDALGA